MLAPYSLHDAVQFAAFLVCAVVDFGVSRRRDRKTGVVYPAGTPGFATPTVAVGVAAWGIFAFLLHQRLTGVNPSA